MQALADVGLRSIWVCPGPPLERKFIQNHDICNVVIQTLVAWCGVSSGNSSLGPVGEGEASLAILRVRTRQLPDKLLTEPQRLSRFYADF